MNLEQEIREAVERQYSFYAEAWRAYATELLAEVDRLRAALGDGGEWTEETPIVDGWYWVRWHINNAQATPAYVDEWTRRNGGTSYGGGVRFWSVPLALPPLPAAEVGE